MQIAALRKVCTFSLSAVSIACGPVASPQTGREEKRNFWGKKVPGVVDGSRKDFQFSWNLLCAVIVPFFNNHPQEISQGRTRGESQCQDLGATGNLKINLISAY